MAKIADYGAVVTIGPNGGGGGQGRVVQRPVVVDGDFIITPRENDLPVVSLERLHQEFDDAAEQLLAKAKETLSDAATVDLDTADALRELGFVRSRTVVEKNSIDTKTRVAKDLSRTIVRYRSQYPDSPFVTSDCVYEICQKYGLVYGPVSNYIGYVPPKNVKEMMEFRVRRFHTKRPEMLENVFGHKRRVHYIFSWIGFLVKCLVSPSIRPKDLLIAAHEREFNMRGFALNARRQMYRVPEDPIVLCDVEGGYLVVTAWGPEAEDVK